MIQLMNENNEVIDFKTTTFPDGTSQVWHVDDKNLNPDLGHYILWVFENEAELFHVCQLAHLCQEVYDLDLELVCPYLPYGRQDKEISNKSTFALSTFKDVLYNVGICRIETFDAHSKSDMVYDLLDGPTVVDFHKAILGKNNYDVICFPDKGASLRYDTYGLESVYCEKSRNPQTGEILGLNLISNRVDLANKRVLIVDDICDGGLTFIKTAELLKTWTPYIDLAVSHGLFSKGKQLLYNAGIKNIYTTNSLPRNSDGFKVW